ncbi:hypothetical protein IY145_10895 [Methylosinus sp. H3A]|uniref:hypothetical protein n=1 Tax=Methylosinus sp. H3A TaxID=2785786 RepID=UPI0018C2E258|nr:hypothetical protein [Methylosinus sp. H3A]MBG0809886.1 hypothetical protein [Methylosinus sp. H3A]
MSDFHKAREDDIDRTIVMTVSHLEALFRLVPEPEETDDPVLREKLPEILSRVDCVSLNVLRLIGHLSSLRMKVRNSDGGANG